jgi:hypothetical protein
MFTAPFFLELSLFIPPPLAPFFDGFHSRVRRTRRLKIQSSIGRVTQTHFGEKARLQIVARQ